MIRANVIGKANGVGLSRDLEIIAAALRACDCQVTFTPTRSSESRQRKSWWRPYLRKLNLAALFRPKTPCYDINVMLEHVWPQYMRQARINIVIPNPEFFDHHDVRNLQNVDKVWAKTQNTLKIFERIHPAVTYIGFDSDDRFDATVQREATFFHLAGSSPLKGTRALLRAWSQHPEWPQLIVVGRLKRPASIASNVSLLDGYQSDEQLRHLQNASAIHLCMSETEGWGHYLVEGLSVGAVVITLSAPPMNELVTQDYGLLLACRPKRQQHLAQCFQFDEMALVSSVERVASMTQHELTAMGNKARDWFLANKAGFHGRIRKALGCLNVQV